MVKVILGAFLIFNNVVSRKRQVLERNTHLLLYVVQFYVPSCQAERRNVLDLCWGSLVNWDVCQWLSVGLPCVRFKMKLPNTNENYHAHFADKKSNI